MISEVYFIFISNSNYNYIIQMSINILPKFALGGLVFLINHVSAQSCWRDGYNRFQVPQPSCPNPTDDPIMPSWVCYPPCSQYWSAQLAADPTGVKCYKDCLKKWTSFGNGDSCSTSGNDYGSGNGYAFNCISCCESDADPGYFNPELGCEDYLLLSVPKCSPGYSKFGCCICTYNGGFPGPFMFGGGSPCSKAFYSRVGQCPTGLVFGTDGFCYPKCINGYDGGKVCYQACPAGTIPCGDVLCLAGTACPATIPAPAVNVKTAVDAAVTAVKQFSIEEIVRAEGAAAITLAGKMCNSLETFAQIDAARTASYNCYQRRFPAFLGSSSGITQIEALELDPNGKIAVGGHTTDSSIFGGTSNVFVGIYESQGFNFTWVTIFQGSLTSVSDIIFEPVPAGTQPTGLLVLFRTTLVTIALINAVTGTVQATLQAPSSLIDTSKAYRLFGADPVSGWISFAFQEFTTSQLTLIGLNLFREPTQTSFNGIRISGNNIKPHSVAMSSNGLSVYVGGIGQFSAPVVGSNVMTLVEFSITADATTYSPSYIQNYFLNQKFSRSKLDIFGSSVFMVAEQVTGFTGSTETGLMIMQKVGTSFSHYNYIENNNNDLKLIDAKGISLQTVYILLINRILPKVRFLEVSFIGSGVVQMIEKILKRPSLLVGELLGARLQVNTQFYLFGTRTSYSSGMSVGRGSVGFFTYSADQNICGGPGTTATFHISTGDAFSHAMTMMTVYSGTFTSTTYTTSMTIISPAVALINLGLVHKLHNTECYKSTVMPALSPISIRYIVDYPEIQFDYPGSYLSPNYCSGDFTFWYSLQNPQPPNHQGTSISPVPVPHPTGPIFFFDWLYPKFKIWIPHPTTYAGFYAINVIGYLQNHQVAVGPTFQIEVYNIPQSATIAPSLIPDLTYVVSDQQLNITWQAFAPSQPHYVIYYLDTQDTDGFYSQGFETGVFNFTQGQRDEKLAVYTKDNNKAKIYNLRIRGKYTPRTPMQCVSNFKVMVLHQCFTTKIMPSYLRREIVFRMSYKPLPQPEIFRFDDWQESVGICKPFIYKALMANGDFLPRFIQFFPNIRQFSVQQTPEMTPGSYLVVLKGVISGFYLMNTVAFNLIVRCQVQQLKTIQPDQTLNYIVGSPALRLQIQEFVQYPRCERPIDYEAVLENGSPLPKAYFNFYNDLNSLGIREMTLSFGMIEVPKVNNYTVHIRAKVESGSYKEKKLLSSLNLTFQIQDTKQFIQAEYPPIYYLGKQGERNLIPFEPFGAHGGQRLLDQRNLQTAFPIVDVEFKKYSMKYLSDAPFEYQITLVETVHPSVKYLQEEGLLELIPSQDTPSGTRYIIKTVITDKNRQRFRISFNLVFIVYISDADNLEQEKGKMIKLLAQTKIEYEKNKFGHGGAFQAQQNLYPKKAEVNGTLQILRVYRNSRAELKLWPSSEQLMISITNNSFMVILSDREKVDYQILSKDAETGKIEISLKFEDTSKISLGNEPDILELILNEKIVLNSANKIVNFQKDLRSQRSIPPLLDKGVQFVAEVLKGGRINIETYLTINILMQAYQSNFLELFAFKLCGSN